MTVVAGYLGAGKTTLINRLLAQPHGLRLLVMVNDFGAINIDAGLLQSRDEDTIALTNGCVCCTMGADLFMAIGDVLDREPRPDHLIIEASGVSDPARIANVALAEPDLSYAGIVTVVDGQTFDDLHQDPLIGPQVMAQVEKADLVWVSKEPAEVQLTALRTLAAASVVTDASPMSLLSLIAPAPAASMVGRQGKDQSHADHLAWSCDGLFCGGAEDLRSALMARPPGLFRVKGIARNDAQTCWRVQVVGQSIDLVPLHGAADPALVGIGLRSQTSEDEIERWWGRACKKDVTR